MPSALCRIMIVVVLLGLVSLDGELWLASAQAASKDQRRDQPLSSKRSRNSKVSIAPTTLPPAVIQNVRTAFSPDLFRLVLDLDRKTLHGTGGQTPPPAEASSAPSRQCPMR